jgi:hypothetical protein
MQRTKKRHVESPDLNRTKFTPRTRPAHEAAHAGSLVNPSPDKRYVMAPTDERHDMSFKFYESAGYNIEVAEKDGVRIKTGDKAEIGKPLTWRGMVLMSCSLERAQEIFESGIDGLTGQIYQDKVMQRIRQNELEKRIKIDGAREDVVFGDLEQRFRE